MSQTRLSPDADIDRLIAEGYEIEVRDAHLIAHSIPYVNARKRVATGKIIATFSRNADGRPATHVVHFVGDYPCDQNGEEIQPLRYLTGKFKIAKGLVASHAFSNKPREGYEDFHQLISTYAAVISNEAQAIDPNATPKTRQVLKPIKGQSPFVYADTASARAGISALASVFAEQTIGIVGLGGTGSYILDFVSKTPVKEIHLFDGDEALQHNAFRAPGAFKLKDLEAHPKKVDHYRAQYKAIHRKITAHPIYVTKQNVEILQDMDFVFLCMDAGPEKSAVLKALNRFGIRYVDAGMGLECIDGRITGTLRVTASTKGTRRKAAQYIPSAPVGDNAVYRQNIQIGELNALNAALAVIKWKKLSGFYCDLEGEIGSAFMIDGNQMRNEVT